MTLHKILYNPPLICWARKLVSRGATVPGFPGLVTRIQKRGVGGPNSEGIAFSNSSLKRSLDSHLPCETAELVALILLLISVRFSHGVALSLCRVLKLPRERTGNTNHVAFIPERELLPKPRARKSWSYSESLSSSCAKALSYIPHDSIWRRSLW